jgi:RNA recognition motif-containing protein
MSRIFVGNLNFGMRDDELRALFAEYGGVEAANVSLDGFTRRSNGYGFVEMPDAGEARSAVDALNGREVNERPLEVRLVISWTAPRISRAVRLEA